MATVYTTEMSVVGLVHYALSTGSGGLLEAAFPFLSYTEIADLMKQPERIVSQTVEVEIRSVD